MWAPHSLLSQITKLSIVLRTRRTCHGIRPDGWNFFLNTMHISFMWRAVSGIWWPDTLSRHPTNTSTKAELNASQPYCSSLSDDEDTLASIFDPGNKTILHMVTALTDCVPTEDSVVLLSISAYTAFLEMLHQGYKSDPWTKSLSSTMPSLESLKQINGLWFVDNCLIIPKTGNLWKTLFCTAHNNLRHFGSKKSYNVLWHSYYWPRRWKDLETAYIPSCPECQKNESSTTKPIGPLYSLPVPD